MVNDKIIRVPEKLYIQTLMAGGFNPPQVIEELQRLNIEVPTNEMQAIVDELKPLLPEVFNLRIAPDDAAIETAGLSPMYYYRFQKPIVNGTIEGCEGSLKMLEDPQLRKIVVALSLAGINPIDVELLVNSRYHVTHESPDFQNFIKYFSNFEDWSYADKEFYIDQRIKEAEFKMILRKAALKGDRHYLVWKLGLGTDPHMSMEQVFTDMMADCYFTFKENIKIRPDDAQKFAQLAIRLSDRMDQSNSRQKETIGLADELKIKLVVESTQADGTKILDIKSVDVELPKRQAVSTNLGDMKFE